MIDGFLSGFFLGFLLWVATIWWHRSGLAKAEAAWMDAYRASQDGTWVAVDEPKKRAKRKR